MILQQTPKVTDPVKDAKPHKATNLLMQQTP